MRRNDKTFKEMVARLQSGEITRHQAADIYQIGYGTLGVWLSRSGVAKSTAGRLPDGSRRLHGAALERSRSLSPDKAKALDAAVARVLAGEISALAAEAENPDLSARTIAQRVRKARIDQGLPVQEKRTRAKTRRDHPSEPFAKTE